MDIFNRFFSPRKNGTDTNNNTSVGGAVTTEETVDTVDAEPPKRKILASDSRTATPTEAPTVTADEEATTATAAAAAGEQPPPVTKKLKTKNDKEEEKDGNKNVTLLQGKIILVTGANRGIGKAFVDTLLQYGATKIYAGVRDVQQTQHNIFNDPWYDERVEPLYLDMREATSIANAAAVIGPLDMVINNAGILSWTRTLDDNCITQLQQEMDVNVYGMVRLIQQFAPLIRATPSCPGMFVQLNSVSSIRCAAPEVATYSASKAASFALTQALRRELHETYGDTIHVLSIHPGPIDTAMIHGPPLLRRRHPAPPPSLVAERFVEALVRHHARDATHSPLPFLLYPDANAKTLGTAYHSYAEIVHEQQRAYG